jgi:hypothetical protein
MQGEGQEASIFKQGGRSERKTAGRFYLGAVAGLLALVDVRDALAEVELS